LNGQSVWSNGMPVAGVNGVSQDAFGVYLSGLGAGTYDVTAVDVAKPAELPVGFTRCAGENGTCAVATKGVVAFGAGTYVYQVATSDTACTSMAFGGDPASGVLKSCYIAPVGVGPAGYTKCADENGTCAFTGTQLVAYGANGAFTNQLATNGVACNNTTFGADPIYGVVKACYLPPAGAPTGWTLCAAENSTCTLSGPQTVAYGAYGSFFYTTASGAVACSNDVFGDPLQNVGKACYTRVGAPAGFASQCASENATCSFSGQQTVAFGAAGRFIYKPFTGGTSCTTTSFGIDPIFDVAKACYLTP
ncbi:MAG TPA: alpha-L-rhamnosidase, partial [Polyangia bacterium]